MKVFSRIKLAQKLPAIMIALTVLTIAISNVVSYRNASKALLAESQEALLTVAEAKSLELQSWLDGLDVDLLSQADNPAVLSAVRGFEESWLALEGDRSGYLKSWYIDKNPNELGRKDELEYAADGSAYSQVHKLYHDYFRKLAKDKGYYDVFLFSSTGDLLYTMAKEQDYATNFVDGEYADSNLGAVVRSALAATAPRSFFADFTHYAPSNGAPAAFLAAPVLDRRGETRGVIAIQLPTERVDMITTRSTGLGRTGDAYIVGEDMLLRSNTIHGNGDDILHTAMDEASSHNVIAGESGVMREMDVNAETGHDHEQMAAYVPVRTHGVKWGLVVEQTIDEILEPATQLAKTIAIQGAVMTLIVAVLAYFIARAISKPLTRVEAAMRTVSEGDYSVEVPGIERGDEIGQIATALDDFRHALGRAEQATSDGLFKGSAFEGSSASLMMINRDFEITYMNAAVRDLMKLHEDTFRQMFHDFNADEIVGKNIDIFHKEPGRIRTILSDPAKMPFSTDMKVGDVHFALDVNSVIDHDGEMIGCVMEWKDVTDIRTNQAVIEALDANQAKAEFSVDGKMMRANANFAHMLGVESESLIDKHYDELFSFDPTLAKENGAVWDRLLNGESVHGRFKLLDTEGNTSVLDGTFNAVKDSSGRPFRIIVIGSDITESQAALVIAEAERERMVAEQNRVVDGLRVGLKRLADGDLTSRIDEKFAAEYETLRADFNDAIGNLLNAMRNVVENADMIRGEASEISNAADDLSRRTEKQAATLEETATALDELTTSVRSAAEGAKQASDMVDTAKANAEASGMVVQEAVEAMGQIETSSTQISKITSVIDDIAFQTNLLALNAGVEAARAGEAGRGFAVVASEVRALAQRSSEAAREINELISKSGTLVKRGVGLVGETGDALRGIVASVTEISANVSEIAVSAREQSSGLAEINAAVNQLDQVTQQNAAMFEETTAASHSLTREAENLNATTSKFSIGAVTGTVPTQAPVKVEVKKMSAPKASNAPAPSVPVAEREPVKQVVNAPMVSAPPAAEDDWEDF
ncbi:methyl-accepting chemotaxis protein [Celeribacter neptunius]|uniref:Methyl-accepting chemotaxis sensory transducer with Pas/Pac sensor n=1 Tax=Celeribacter neptunius TaxID=588602 RepID=A0A1I3LGA9_9RHOB|nr:methyl-accepting chemotaxis protein [Celeribacter neptunius]SFI83802.1 methyl-accepting chemotaxis sensory transducer with Pas/Pac sensor [Celeribacter neptunius]